MRRKVNRVGPNTLTISLPRQWVKAHRITKGDELEVQEAGNALQISRDAAERKRRITINLSTYDGRMIKLALNNLYRLAYDEIICAFKNRAQLNTIQALCERNYPGFEVVSSTENSCVLENILKIDETRFDVLYRRIFILIKEMLDTYIRSYEQKKMPDPKEIDALHQKVEQYVNFCIRTLFTSGEDLRHIYTYLLTFVLNISSTLRRMQNADPPGQIALSFLKDFAEQFCSFYTGHFKNDLHCIRMIDAELEKLLASAPYEEGSGVVVCTTAQVVRFLLVVLSPTTIILSDTDIQLSLYDI